MSGGTVKQLQIVGFGAATSYYLDTFSKLGAILERNAVYSLPWWASLCAKILLSYELTKYWNRLSTSLALLCAAISTIVFLYVLVYLPRVKGVKIDVSHMIHLALLLGITPHSSPKSNSIRTGRKQSLNGLSQSVWLQWPLFENISEY